MDLSKTRADKGWFCAALCAASASTAVLGAVAMMFDAASRDEQRVPAELDAPALAVCDTAGAGAARERERDRCRARVLAQLRRNGGTPTREAAREKPRLP